jgi:hypothetical protein
MALTDVAIQFADEPVDLGVIEIEGSGPGLEVPGHFRLDVRRRSFWRPLFQARSRTGRIAHEDDFFRRLIYRVDAPPGGSPRATLDI